MMTRAAAPPATALSPSHSSRRSPPSSGGPCSVWVCCVGVAVNGRSVLVEVVVVAASRALLDRWTGWPPRPHSTHHRHRPALLWDIHHRHIRCRRHRSRRPHLRPRAVRSRRRRWSRARRPNSNASLRPPPSSVRLRTCARHRTAVSRTARRHLDRARRRPLVWVACRHNVSNFRRSRRQHGPSPAHEPDSDSPASMARREQTTRRRHSSIDPEVHQPKAEMRRTSTPTIRITPVDGEEESPRPAYTFTRSRRRLLLLLLLPFLPPPTRARHPPRDPYSRSSPHCAAPFERALLPP